jgi:hypothetical protein
MEYGLIQKEEENIETEVTRDTVKGESIGRGRLTTRDVEILLFFQKWLKIMAGEKTFGFSPFPIKSYHRIITW